DAAGKPTLGALVTTTADLLAAPVLFLSGSQALNFDLDQRRMLKEYVESGGFLFAEACNGHGCDGTAFDRSFRALVQELVPGRELQKLPHEHAISPAQHKVEREQLPQEPDLELRGRETCPRRKRERRMDCA